ncbi:MAG TPA: cob(I)yrinic acid a,c-diamide adenosyltransferase [Acidobacteria bacterium]|nr:cob(I)yrinic acid a,c-diamide adenosyltransferase [Acidobacteriota bacterium]
MARLTKIYTRKGDDGSTRLGSGEKVGKDDLQVRAYGTVDEVGAFLGMVLAEEPDPQVSTELRRIQSELFNLGGQLSLLARDGDEVPALITAEHVRRLEQACDRFNADLEPLENFILSGGTRAAAWLHLARTVCRRAEREMVALAARQSVPGSLLEYVNRLSDLLFILARWENRRAGGADVLWDTSV